MSSSPHNEFERLIAAHIELGSTREEAVALARAALEKPKPIAPRSVPDSALTMRRQRNVRRSVRFLTLGILPAVLLSNAFVYRFDYGWSWLFLMSAGLPALAGFCQGVRHGIGSARAWLKESVKVIPHLAVIYLLWSTTQDFHYKIFFSLSLALLHGTLALIVGALSALIGGMLSRNDKAEKAKDFA